VTIIINFPEKWLYSNLDWRVSQQEDVFTGSKVPPLLAKMRVNEALSFWQGGT
jgi:hypothetical protein